VSYTPSPSAKTSSLLVMLSGHLELGGEMRFITSDGYPGGRRVLLARRCGAPVNQRRRGDRFLRTSRSNAESASEEAPLPLRSETRHPQPDGGVEPWREGGAPASGSFEPASGRLFEGREPASDALTVVHRHDS